MAQAAQAVAQLAALGSAVKGKAARAAHQAPAETVVHPTAEPGEPAAALASAVQVAPAPLRVVAVAAEVTTVAVAAVPT